GNRPNVLTHLLSSAITTMRAEAAATIFSRNSAPPPPLIRVRSGPISSAPSTVMSSSDVSSSVVSGTPRRCASARVVSEVGTPIDTAPDLIETLNVVFTRDGLPPLDYTAARNMIGGGARRMIESSLKLQGRVLADNVVDRMFADFVAHYAAHVADRSQPFPGL